MLRIKELEEQLRIKSDEFMRKRQQIQAECTTTKELLEKKTLELRVAEDKWVAELESAHNESQQAKAQLAQLQTEKARQLKATANTSTLAAAPADRTHLDEEFRHVEQLTSRIQELEEECADKVEASKREAQEERARLVAHYDAALAEQVKAARDWEEKAAQAASRSQQSYESRKCLELRAQVRELQEALIKKHPSMALQRVPEAENDIVGRLEAEIRTLKEKHALKELEWDKKLRLLRQDHDRVNAGYDHKVKALLEQVRDLETCRTRVKELETQLASVRRYYRSKLAGVVAAPPSPPLHASRTPHAARDRLTREPDMLTTAEQRQGESFPDEAPKPQGDCTRQRAECEALRESVQRLTDEVQRLRSELQRERAAAGTLQRTANEAIRQAQQTAMERVATMQQTHQQELQTLQQRLTPTIDRQQQELQRLKSDQAAAAQQCARLQHCCADLTRENGAGAEACSQAKVELARAVARVRYFEDAVRTLQQEHAADEAELAHLRGLKDEWMLEATAFAGADAAQLWRRYDAALCEKNRQIAQFQAELASLMSALEQLRRTSVQL
eukprot:TRINITY_DN748_c0_g1_i5.p1 TRINITY_DN748_c0_g1~~TRINITY_DN748_c0_g1_i5.p1  ORF type:complete len:562 (-),score=163.85 TRINITY_DN748_c0_g1_i5:25-1710(-)